MVDACGIIGCSEGKMFVEMTSAQYEAYQRLMATVAEYSKALDAYLRADDRASSYFDENGVEDSELEELAMKLESDLYWRKSIVVNKAVILHMQVSGK